MRRRLILLAVGLSVAGVLAVGSSTQARAGGNGATVVRDGGVCFVADDTGAWLFSCNIQFVIQSDGTINHHLTGSVIPEESSPLPSRPTTQICRSGSARSFQRKARSFPSGDQTGEAGAVPDSAGR